MDIRNIHITESTQFNELSGYCGDYHLWYRFPKEIKLVKRADAFVAAALIPAMALGEDINIPIDIPISPSFLKNIDKIQKILLLWSDYHDKQLKFIRIIGGTQQKANGNDKTISFFSGGVDGLYTFKQHQNEIDVLVFSKGIDMQLENVHLYNQAFTENKKYLEIHGKQLISVSTNVRFLGHKHQVGWQNYCCGSGLSSIALAGRFKKCFIASSDSYAIMPTHGSNYVTNPLWSNEHTQIIHDGAETRRIDKIKFLAKDDQNAIKILRVCWQDNGYNCGQCSKCLRTMVSLRLLGLKSQTLPDLTNKDLSKIAKTKLFGEGNIALTIENLETAIDVNDIPIIKALSKCVQDVNRRQLIKQFDKAFFCGNLLEFKRNLQRKFHQ